MMDLANVGYGLEPRLSTSLSRHFFTDEYLVVTNLRYDFNKSSNRVFSDDRSIFLHIFSWQRTLLVWSCSDLTNSNHSSFTLSTLDGAVNKLQLQGFRNVSHMPKIFQKSRDRSYFKIILLVKGLNLRAMSSLVLHKLHF